MPNRLAVLASGVLTLNTTDNADSYLISRVGGSADSGEIVKVKDLKSGIENTFGTALVGVKSITADGKGGNDLFDLSGAGSPTTVPITVSGGSGNNTIKTRGETNTWNLTGPGAGNVNGITFTNFTNLDGGFGGDTYKFADVALGSFTIDERAGGTDTLDFSASSLGVTVDLSMTTAQVVNANLTLTLVSGASIENVIGTAQNDVITGNSLDNMFPVTAGTDTIDGGTGKNTLVATNAANIWNLTSTGAGTVGSTTFSNFTNLTGGSGNDSYKFGSGSLGAFYIDESLGGIDTLDFSANTADLAVNLGTVDQQTIRTGLQLTLSAVNVFENVIGGSGNDTLTGNELPNTLTGGAGNDTLVGGLADDTYILSANGGNDTITEASGGGIDTLDFSAFTADSTVTKKADGTFSLTAGTSTLNFTNVEKLVAGTGNNSLDFSASTSGVVVDLSAEISTDFVSLKGFRNVTGSAFADAITGNALDNVLSGGAGDDFIRGAERGPDIIDGGSRGWIA